ncbi:AAA family ATPase [Methylomonas sp. LL1]|uniref:AAA family ATPase n=1 Tax=Methylomonas sp. LL1 TaxID=2785785 RepID=UPI0018C447B6|nr:AAA family ATPase [Methylomonas sp. LL1]QPK62571.1 AAA family ATPase [Methylomonas sp. LL1]
MFNHPAFSLEQDENRTIVGIVESIIYANDAISILKLSLGDESIKAVITRLITPDLPRLGEIWELFGADEVHPKYGDQFVAQECFRQHPVGKLIVNYIHYHTPGIGVFKARQLWTKFGQNLYWLLDKGDIDPLTDKKLGKIPTDIAYLLIDKWHKNKVETEVVRFFQKNGLTTSLAIFALQFFGVTTIEKIIDNPYRLLAFTNFPLVDKQAITFFGVALHDPRRMSAAVSAAIYKAYDAGNTAILKKDLIQSIRSLTQFSKQDAQLVIEQALLDRTIVISDEFTYQGFGHALMERFIAQKIANLLSHVITGELTGTIYKFKPELLAQFEQMNNITLTNQQKQAVETAITHRFSIIDGGKGVGKTTCLSVLHYLLSNTASVFQVALSRDAVKRISMATHKEASSISSFLFRISEERLPAHSKLVVYDAHTIDLPTMIRLMRAIPDSGSIVLLGDSRQLPPIGPGLIFHALCMSPIIPTITLTQLHCFDASSSIPIVADSIRLERIPCVSDFDKTCPEDKQVGLCHISIPSEDIAKITVSFRHFILKWGDIQIIAPTVSLCDDINIRIHDSYRKDNVGNVKALVKCTKSIGLDDVIVCKDNLDYKGLSSGSLGKVIQVFDSPIAQSLPSGEIELCYALAEFDGHIVKLSAADFKKIKLGYCIPCNSAQGSEFDRVIIAMPASTILDNSWVYTAITCAKIQAFIIGDIKVFYENCTTPPKAFKRCIGFSQTLRETFNG